MRRHMTATFSCWQHFNSREKNSLNEEAKKLRTRFALKIMVRARVMTASHWTWITGWRKSSAIIQLFYLLFHSIAVLLLELKMENGRKFFWRPSEKNFGIWTFEFRYAKKGKVPYKTSWFFNYRIRTLNFKIL